MKMNRSGSALGSCPGPSLPQSPSFKEYSSGTMADTAARVISEFVEDDYYYGDINLYSSTANDLFPEPDCNVVPGEAKPDHLDEDDDDCSFEFPIPGCSPASADQIKPLFPLFNTDLVFSDTDWRDGYNFDHENRSVLQFSDSKSLEPDSVRLPLKKLMISERQTSVTESASCSSSEADDLEGVAPDTYCVWDPAKNNMRKKSKSTGSSKRWKIRDLLYRSHSDGADSFVVLASKQHDQKKAVEKKAYMNKKTTGEDDRKRFQIPYKHDPVGFFSRINGLSRTIQPF